MLKPFVGQFVRVNDNFLRRECQDANQPELTDKTGKVVEVDIYENEDGPPDYVVWVEFEPFTAVVCEDEDGTLVAPSFDESGEPIAMRIWCFIWSESFPKKCYLDFIPENG